MYISLLRVKLIPINTRGLYFNHDAERAAKNDDSFRSQVLKECVHIINIPNSAEKECDRVIKESLEWIRYENALAESQLKWPPSAGRNSGYYRNSCAATRMSACLALARFALLRKSVSQDHSLHVAALPAQLFRHPSSTKGGI